MALAFRCRWRLLAWSLGWLVCASQAAEAAGGSGGGQVYKVTITTIEISTDGGSTYTTLFSGSQEIDIAGVDAGAVAAGLVSGADLPDGTYNTVRATVARTIKVKGYRNIGGTTYYTNGQSDSNAFSTRSGTDNPPTDSTFAESTFDIGGPASETKTGLAIVMSQESSPIVTVKFNTAGVVTESGGLPSIGAPTVDISVR